MLPPAPDVDGLELALRRDTFAFAPCGTGGGAAAAAPGPAGPYRDGGVGDAIDAVIGVGAIMVSDSVLEPPEPRRFWVWLYP